MPLAYIRTVTYYAIACAAHVAHNVLHVCMHYIVVVKELTPLSLDGVF